MIDFIISIDDCTVELDSRQSWKIGYRLSTILFLVFDCQLAGVETLKELEVFIEMN
ncbi:ISAs1 family transposase, partial [Streptococcus pyogenes]